MCTFEHVTQTAVTQPLIQKMVNIPPALTILGLVTLAMLGGFWGVLLAVPVVVILIYVLFYLITYMIINAEMIYH